MKLFVSSPSFELLAYRFRAYSIVLDDRSMVLQQNQDPDQIEEIIACMLMEGSNPSPFRDLPDISSILIEQTMEVNVLLSSWFQFCTTICIQSS